MLYRLRPGLSLRSRLRPYKPPPGEEVLVLRTAAVFPPGHHTTRLCLALLCEALEGRPVASLLDLGCGSGVLALAAAALGVPRVTAVDLSARAARLTWDNARRNGMASRVDVVQGTGACLAGPFEVIAANLPFKVQLAEAAALGRLASPCGTLILGGFRDVQEEALLARYRPEGWEVSARRTADDWPHTLPPEGSFTWVAWRLARCGVP
jgi:ribosomal protein L11 methyltransferase